MPCQPLLVGILDKKANEIIKGLCLDDADDRSLGMVAWESERVDLGGSFEN